MQSKRQNINVKRYLYSIYDYMYYNSNVENAVHRITKIDS